MMAKDINKRKKALMVKVYFLLNIICLAVRRAGLNNLYLKYAQKYKIGGTKTQISNKIKNLGIPSNGTK